MDDKKNHVCRVCLKFGTAEMEMLYVFEKYRGEYINEKINYVVNIDIKQDDGLPDKICSSCVHSLETACSFKRTCKESDNILQSALQPKEATDGKHEDIDVKREAEESGDYFEDDSTSPVGFETDYDIKNEYELIKLDGKDYCGTDPGMIELDLEKSDTPRPSRAIDLHLECHDCGGFFKSKCKLSVHWKKQHMPSQLICPKCKKTCKTYKTLHSHIKQKTSRCLLASQLKITGVGKSRIFHCTVCGYSAKTAEYVIKHRVQHTGEKSYSCEMCGKAYSQLGGLIIHKEQVHKTRIIEMTCDLCGKHIVGRPNVYRHKMSHKSPNQFPCEICKKVLKSKATLRNHMIRHGNVKGESCDICQKSFYTKCEVLTHKQKVHIKSKLYKCDLCSFESRVYTCVDKHKKRHTSTNVPCEICGTFVENVQQLKIHRLRHNKTIQCMYCDLKVFRQKNLIDHLRRKHGIRQGINKNKKKRIQLQMINYST